MPGLYAAADQLVAVGGFQVHEKLAGAFIPAFIGRGEMLCDILTYFKTAFINARAHISETIVGPGAVVVPHGGNRLFDDPAYGTAPARVNGRHRACYGVVDQDRRAIGNSNRELNASYIGHQGIESLKTRRRGNRDNIGAMHLVRFCDSFERYAQCSEEYQVVLHDIFGRILRAAEVQRRVVAGAYTAMARAFGGNQFGELAKYLWFAEYRLFVGREGSEHSSEINGKRYQN